MSLCTCSSFVLLNLCHVCSCQQTKKELRAVDVDIFGDSITHDETVASVVS